MNNKYDYTIEYTEDNILISVDSYELFSSLATLFRHSILQESNEIKISFPFIRISGNSTKLASYVDSVVYKRTKDYAHLNRCYEMEVLAND